MSAALVTLDGGTSGGRAVVFDLDGRSLGQAERRWHFQPVPELEPLGWELDAPAFWAAMAEATREALAAAGGPEVRAVCTTGFRCGSVLLGPDGEPVIGAPVRDVRGLTQGGAIDEAVPDFYERMGLTPTWLAPVARLLWYRREAPALYERGAHFLTVADWLAHRLAGEAATTASSAADTGLFDLATRAWADDVLAALDLDPALLPPVVPAGAVLGRVRADAAEATGLPAGIPVVAGAGDTTCALVGAGVLDPGREGVVAGSSAPVVRVTDRVPVDPSRRMWAGCHAADDRWTLESNCGRAGEVVELMTRILLAGSTEPFADLERLAGGVEAGSTGTYALLGPGRFDLGGVSPMRPAALFFPLPELGVEIGRGELLRATLENVAFAVRANLEQIGEADGEADGPLTVSGGMTRSDLFCRIIADVTGRPLQVAAEAQTTGLGGAVLSATALGEGATLAEAAGRMSRPRAELEPGPDAVRAYGSAYSCWREHWERLRFL